MYESDVTPTLEILEFTFFIRSVHAVFTQCKLHCEYRVLLAQNELRFSLNRSLTKQLAYLRLCNAGLIVQFSVK